MEKLSFQNFIKEAGLLKEIQEIIKTLNDEQFDEKGIMEKLKKTFLNSFSKINRKVLEKYSNLLKSYNVLINPKDIAIHTNSYVIITKECIKTIRDVEMVIILDGIIELINVKKAYAKNNSIVKLIGSKDCIISALDKSTVIIDGSATGWFYDKSKGIAKGNSSAYFQNNEGDDCDENIVTDKARATSYGSKKIACFKNSFCRFSKYGCGGSIFDESTAIVEDGSIISCFDKTKAIGKDTSTIHAYENSSVELKDFSRCFLNENAKVKAKDKTVVYARRIGFLEDREIPTAIMSGDSVIFIEKRVSKEKIILKDKSTPIAYEL